MKVHIAVLYFLIAVLISAEFFLHYETQKSVYVITTELYGKFRMTGELDKKIKKLEDLRKAITDSLVYQLKMKQQLIQNAQGKDDKMNSEFEGMKQEYLLKQKQFNEDNEKIKQQYSDEVWTQLNQYMQEYGKKHNCQFILGATGQGTLMYADEKTNVTNDLIEYVNQRYNDTAK